MTVRLLIVEDSRVMQEMIRRDLSADASIEVVGTAANANEARALVKTLEPNVLTLDVEMPGMNGLDFLDRLMRLRPTPVVMLSSLTSRGAEVTLAALEIGAFDCFDKARLSQDTRVAQPGGLAEIVCAAAASRTALRHRASAPRNLRAVDDAYAPRSDSLVAIGASTGGVEALITLLADFPANCPPTVIVQHMPESFTSGFAARLDRLCRPSVEQARPGAVLTAGKVYIAPGGLRHLEVAGSGSRRHCALVEGDKVSGHRPSVDRLFHSVARTAGPGAVGALLTGMGADGAEGLKAMRDVGAMTIGQDKASSIVYGMPAIAQRIGAVVEQQPLRRIAGRLLSEASA